MITFSRNNWRRLYHWRARRNDNTPKEIQDQRIAAAEAKRARKNANRLLHWTGERAKRPRRARKAPAA